MTWLVLTVIFGIIGIMALVAALGSTDRYTKGWGWGIWALVTVVWVVLTLGLSIHSVGQREVGVVYNFSGTIAGQKSPGVVMTWPWQHVKTESVAVTKDTFVFDANNSAVSKDQQPITATIVVNYEVKPQDVLKLFKSVGPNWKTVLLDGRVPQDFKETTAGFTSPEITLNRPLLRKLTLGRLQREMCPQTAQEPWCVDIVDVFISNVGYSRAYTQAIEDKQVQVQQALQAEAKVAQAKAEADQSVATARGQAESTLLRAEAEAKALSVKGQALHNNPEILQLEAIDKLNPNAQVIICTGSGQGNCPSFLPQVK